MVPFKFWLRLPLVLGIMLCAIQSNAQFYDSAEQLMYKGRYRESLSRCSTAISVARVANNPFELGYFYLLAGENLLYLNRTDSLDKCFDEAVRNLDSAKHTVLFLRARLGQLELKRRVNPSATMDAYLELLSLARSLGDNELYYLVLDKVSTVNYGLENYEQATQQARESIAYYRATGDSVKLALRYRLLSGQFRGMGEIDSTIFYLEKAIDLVERMQVPVAICSNYHVLGWVLLDIDLKRAETYLRKAEELDEKYYIQNTQLPFVVSLLEEQKGNLETAVKKARVSYSRAWNAKQLFINFQCAEAMARYFKKMNRLDSALHYTELYVHLKDSIRGQKQYKDAGRMQAKFELERIQFKKDLEAKEELKRREFLLRFVLVSVVVLLLVAFLLYRAYRISKRNERKIFRQNREKELLLKEIHHRVKNNLSILSGILDLQQRNQKDENLRSIFQDAKSRINSMALVHKNLYEQSDFSEPDTQTYFENLFNAIAAGYKPIYPVRGIIQCGGIEMNLDTLIPLALITNELLTNSFKYAFQDGVQKQPTCTISLSGKVGNFVFVYSDNGSGISNQDSVTKGLGSTLVEGLSRQLGGEAARIETDTGVCYKISFAGIRFHK